MKPRADMAAAALLVALATGVVACAQKQPANQIRVSGYVEATEVQVAPEVGGRLVDLRVKEGDRVRAGDVIAQLDTADVQLTLERAQAERQASDAQLRLLEAGSRVEDVRQAEAQVSAGEADVAAAGDELKAAQQDLDRFESLLASNSGSRKQRDDALTRRDVARQRLRSAEQRVRAANETLARLKAGPRRQEIDAARARVAGADAQIATLQKNLSDATVKSPVGGVVSQKLVDVGELVAPRAPLVVVTDIEHAWANVYVDDPFVPRLHLNQRATIFTDAGGPGIQGTVSFISPKAEFTPRNVQTAMERSKLVYRVKVDVDNSKGVLKQGMPVEAELRLAGRS